MRRPAALLRRSIRTSTRIGCEKNAATVCSRIGTPYSAWTVAFGRRLPGNSDVIGLEVTFPSHDLFLLNARRPPPGVVPEKLEKPLTLVEAEHRARRVLARITGDAARANRFELTDSGEVQDDWDDFAFCEHADARLHYLLAYVRVNLRRSDGFVTLCDWRTYRLRPKVPYEKVVEMAKAAGRTGDRTDDIVLYTHYNAGIGTLTWDYRIPPDPDRGGITARDETWWDAMTGELIYSVVLDGGTGHTPYKNPKYFPAVNDELIKHNLEKIIKDRAAELESEKRDKQGSGKATPGN